MARRSAQRSPAPVWCSRGRRLRVYTRGTPLRASAFDADLCRAALHVRAPLAAATVFAPFGAAPGASPLEFVPLIDAAFRAGKRPPHPAMVEWGPATSLWVAVSWAGGVRQRPPSRAATHAPCSSSRLEPGRGAGWGGPRGPGCKI